MFYSFVTGSSLETPISVVHFLLTVAVGLLSVVAMGYFMRMAVLLKGDKNFLKQNESTHKKGFSKTYLNPIQAVSDYRAGHISRREMIIRKVITFISILALFLSVFSPTKYFLYDIISSVVFLVIYLFVLFFVNKK